MTTQHIFSYNLRTKKVNYTTTIADTVECLILQRDDIIGDMVDDGNEVFGIYINLSFDNAYDEFIEHISKKLPPESIFIRKQRDLYAIKKIVEITDDQRVFDLVHLLLSMM